ncbi:hypothetical protein RBSWK_06129 [Rhodopirellula baltica SWK14]|uniref:Uncharacterized protein n=1 Tax=Rhodopirellula baltica SWK14 TaxID=993516 RepID=L7CAB6_RHOBT|nr:hypothetical protein RBSWK_06129 [Rhodopirellula baltica SWK14]
MPQPPLRSFSQSNSLSLSPLNITTITGSTIAVSTGTLTTTITA